MEQLGQAQSSLSSLLAPSTNAAHQQRPPTTPTNNTTSLHALHPIALHISPSPTPSFTRTHSTPTTSRVQTSPPPTRARRRRRRHNASRARSRPTWQVPSIHPSHPALLPFLFMMTAQHQYAEDTPQVAAVDACHRRAPADCNNFVKLRLTTHHFVNFIQLHHIATLRADFSCSQIFAASLTVEGVCTCTRRVTLITTISYSAPLQHHIAVLCTLSYFHTARSSWRSLLASSKRHGHRSRHNQGLFWPTYRQHRAPCKPVTKLEEAKGMYHFLSPYLLGNDENHVLTTTNILNSLIAVVADTCGA